MQDEMLTAALILLILAHGVLIRSCYALHTTIPQQSTEVQTRLDGVTSLLDEALDMIAEHGSALSPVKAHQNPFEAGGGNILSTLISSMMLNRQHGHQTQPQEWEVYPPNEPTPTNE